MAAKFTNLRPAETKPLDVLLALHTPLYPWGEWTPFYNSIAQVGLPAGIPQAAQRIGTQDIRDRAWYALMGGVPAGSPLGGPNLLALARLMARMDARETLAQVKQHWVVPSLRAAILAAQGEPMSVTLPIVRDDLLAMILVPGAFADYRRIANRLLVLAPRIGQLAAALDFPVRTPIPEVWRAILLGRILFPGQIGFRAPPATAPGTGTGTSTSTGTKVVHAAKSGINVDLGNAGLTQGEIRQINAIASTIGMSDWGESEVVSAAKAPAGPSKTTSKTTSKSKGKS